MTSPLLDRYLYAVGQYLPTNRRDDLLAELRANLESQIEDRDEALGRPLSEPELTALIQAHGRPTDVAAQYAPQPALIAPDLIPHYWLTLRATLLVVIVLYAITQTILQTDPADAVLRAPWVLFLAWAWLTFAFIAFDLIRRHFHRTRKPWDPARLLQLPTLPRPSRKSHANRIADFVATAIFTAYFIAVPVEPWLILGPGVGTFRGLPLRVSPQWHIFYLELILLMLPQLLLKATMLFGPERRWFATVRIAIETFGVLLLTAMVKARITFTADTASHSKLLLLGVISHWTNVALQLALVLSTLHLCWSFYKNSERRKCARRGPVLA